MSHLLWYTIRMIMNEDNEQLNALLDAICEGVEVPTDEEAEEAKQAQQGDSPIL